MEISVAVRQLPFATVSSALLPASSALKEKFPSASVQPQPAAASASSGASQDASSSARPVSTSVEREPETNTVASARGSLPPGASTWPLTSTCLVSGVSVPELQAASSRATAAARTKGNVVLFIRMPPFLAEYSFRVAENHVRPDRKTPHEPWLLSETRFDWLAQRPVIRG